MAEQIVTRRWDSAIVSFVKNGRAYKSYGAFGLLVVLLYLLPATFAIQNAILGVFGWATFAALLVGLIVWRPVPLSGWSLLAASQLMYALGDVARELPRLGLPDALSDASASLYIVGSLCFSVAMPLVYWHFRKLIRSDNLVEGVIIGLGFVLVSWIVIISPNAVGGASGLNMFDGIIYPALLVLLVFFASLFLLTPLGDVWSFRLLFGVLAGLLISAYVSGLVSQGRIPALFGTPYGLADTISVLALTLLGVAYLHPSFGTLRDLKPQTGRRSLRWLDLIALALAFGLAGAIWLIQTAGTLHPNTVIVIAGMMIVFVLVEWRLVQLFQTVEQQNTELLALDKLKNQFLAGMTHELRTPLNSIINFSQFMQTGAYGPVTSEQRDALERVSTSGEHLLSMINDVLDYAKIQAGMVTLFVETDVSLNQELAISASAARGLLANKPVVFRQEVPENLPLLVADRRRIRQIFINLLSNACKFTDRGEICLAAEQQNENILVRVSDSGSGISAQEGALIFEPFRQAQAGLRHGAGSGLGLPIAKSFVEAHHGKIWFESEPHQGTTFFVLLPIHHPELVRLAQ